MRSERWPAVYGAREVHAKAVFSSARLPDPRLVSQTVACRWTTDTYSHRTVPCTLRNDPLNIRPGTRLDRDDVIALWESVFPDNPPHNAPARMFDAKLAIGDDLLFVATDADHVIGTAMAGYDGHRGWLYTVAVAPGHRRCGIGTELVRHAVDALRAAGCIKVNLQIRATNTAVRGFYESLEFEAEDRLSMGLHIR